MRGLIGFNFGLNRFTIACLSKIYCFDIWLAIPHQEWMEENWYCVPTNGMTKSVLTFCKCESLWNNISKWKFGCAVFLWNCSTLHLWFDVGEFQTLNMYINEALFTILEGKERLKNYLLLFKYEQGSMSVLSMISEKGFTVEVQNTVPKKCLEFLPLDWLLSKILNSLLYDKQGKHNNFLLCSKYEQD